MRTHLCAHTSVRYSFTSGHATADWLPHPDCLEVSVDWFTYLTQDEYAALSNTSKCPYDAAQTSSRRQLRAGKGSGSPTTTSDIQLYGVWRLVNQGDWALLWLAQGCAVG